MEVYIPKLILQFSEMQEYVSTVSKYSLREKTKKNFFFLTLLVLRKPVPKLRSGWKLRKHLPDIQVLDAAALYLNFMCGLTWWLPDNLYLYSSYGYFGFIHTIPP